MRKVHRVPALALRVTWRLPLDRRIAAELGLLLLDVLRCTDRIRVEYADSEGFMIIVEPVGDVCAELILHNISENKSKFLSVELERWEPLLARR